MNSKEFIEKLKWLVELPNVYHSENGTWCTWKDNKWRMDCVVSIKGLLWGFKADKSKPHGGAIYGSNGVADFGANQGINYCNNASQDFSNLVPGEYLCMKGTSHEHAGVYLGNGKVFECTVGWGVNRCIISDMDNKGNRTYKGVANGRWTWHGKLKYIDYIEDSKKSNEEIAREVLEGKWGNGEERKRRLTDAGYNYSEVQSIVNRLVNGNKKSNEQIADEVIQGKWGNGQERKDRLTKAGYNYSEVQAIVNRKCR